MILVSTRVLESCSVGLDFSAGRRGTTSVPVDEVDEDARVTPSEEDTEAEDAELCLR